MPTAPDHLVRAFAGALAGALGLVIILLLQGPPVADWYGFALIGTLAISAGLSAATAIGPSDSPWRQPIRTAWIGMVLGGGAGTLLGFFLPIIIGAGSRFGPELGPFFLGPAAALLGALGGLARALWRRQRSRAAS